MDYHIDCYAWEQIFCFLKGKKRSVPLRPETKHLVSDEEEEEEGEEEEEEHPIRHLDSEVHHVDFHD